MKRLLILRHAKAERGDWMTRDFDRELTGQGMSDAARVGKFMGESLSAPDLVLSSSAVRAAQTAMIALEAAGFALPIEYDGRIYEAGAGRLLNLILEINANAETALLVGHNPGLSEVLSVLIGEAREMPTASLAEIALDVETWSEARPLCGKLERITKLSDLPDKLAP